MTTRYPIDASARYSPPDRRGNGSNERYEDPITRHQMLQSTGQTNAWPSHQLPPSTTSMGFSSNEPFAASYSGFVHPDRQNQNEWLIQPTSDPQEWHTRSPLSRQFPGQSPTSPYGGSSGRRGFPGSSGSWPGPLLRRTSSDDNTLYTLGQKYAGSDMSSSVPSLSSKTHPQRRPSNRDEFDGPSQFLEKPDDSSHEPIEDEMPRLPVSLYAQEQDEILSHVNDGLSQCAFDFVAKYQFPVPIEADKRPVRVASDREWSEWVYLLKRLATKRRIPARVLFNGQIKQLITILENSQEMRHAAKHQSRPLKDDRNVLQLISSGIQVAKILKDAPAMQFLDGLYVQTERTIQARRATAAATFSTMCVM